MQRPERFIYQCAGLRPGLDGRGGRPHMLCSYMYCEGLELAAAYADVLEAEGAEAGGVQQVLGVNDDGVFEEMLDAIEIKSAELGPAGANHQGIRAFGRSIGRVAIAHRAVQARLGFGNRDWIVGTNVRALGDQRFRQAQRMRIPPPNWCSA